MRKSTKIGDIIKIPYSNKLHTYGRVLVDGSYAIYDCPSSSDIEDYEKIIKSDILFTAHVDIFAVKEGYWTIIKNIPLEEKLKNFYPRYFNPAPTNPVNFNFYQVYQDEIEEAIKKDWIKTGRIQLHGIHGREHIEKRIEDYYSGRKNGDNKAIIFLFKKLNGLPVSTEDDTFSKDNSKEVIQDNTLEKDYAKRLVETKHYYPFIRWEQLFENGFEQYSPQNCRDAKLILDNLIKSLTEIGEHASEESKIKLFVETVKALNGLNDRSEGVLIETDEREELCEFFNQLTIAVGLNPGDYGEGEGIASEYRTW